MLLQLSFVRLPPFSSRLVRLNGDSTWHTCNRLALGTERTRLVWGDDPSVVSFRICWPRSSKGSKSSVPSSRSRRKYTFFNLGESTRNWLNDTCCEQLGVSSQATTSLRQNYLQLQHKAALMSRRIRAVEHRKCAAGLAGAHHVMQDWILLNYTRIKNAHKVRKKTFDFLLCIEVQQTHSFLFSLLRHYQMPECFCVNNCGFKLVQQLSCYRNW